MANFPTDWNIDYYHEDAEPEEHWELRQAFMKFHKGKFSEEYLVALSKTFANIEFLGCIYPDPLMAKIADLSKDIVKKYRVLKAKRLQRKFIAGSEAARQKK
ncbi:nf-kappa-b-repressing factor-related [Holotrichia oblita]|uniref:Nf-kappa-b-repressing factor-related n=1 Tax=Holotrichia oblita TaxID=644536 RepID=A0ACB9TF48_HOLOL|nr:nf-kappa-b-repressing factor-related [Holotrichia oblita]